MRCSSVSGCAIGSLSFPLCHYSLITTPAEKLRCRSESLTSIRWPRNGLATIHYLFKADLGGTAFYRHRKTGFEYIDESRNESILQIPAAREPATGAPGPGYINGDTDLFEQIAKQDGVFNRMLVYRRNSLHSGCIAADFVPDPNPVTGRLSINSFIDWTP